MSLVASIRTYLLTQPAVVALVSKIYPVIIPQGNDDPVVSIQLITEPRTYTLDGTEQANGYVQIDAWSENYETAHAVIEAIKTALSGYRGTMGTTNVQLVLIRAKRESYDDTTKEYRVAIDCAVWHTD